MPKSANRIKTAEQACWAAFNLLKVLRSKAATGRITLDARSMRAIRRTASQLRRFTKPKTCESVRRPAADHQAYLDNPSPVE